MAPQETSPQPTQLQQTSTTQPPTNIIQQPTNIIQQPTSIIPPQPSTVSATVAPPSPTLISEILQSAIDPNSCGYGTSCDDGQSCYIDPPDLIYCADDSTIPSPPPTHWRLNATTFPPIEYMGDKIGTSEGHSCESLGELKRVRLWVESFALVHWAPNNQRNSYPLPQNGSFLNALSFIGSCIDNFSDQNHTRFYCSEDNTCESKLSGGDTCQSSNQCASAKCGSLSSPLGFSDISTNSTCDDSFSSLDFLTANRTRPPNVAIHLSQPPSGFTGGSGGTTSGGQAAVVAVCIIIIVISLALIAYSRRLFKKHDALGDNGRGGVFLNRNNSVTSLPPYRVVDDNQPLGLLASINHWFSPPGELPPPYEVVDSRPEVRVDNNDNNNNNTSNDDHNNNNNSSDPATIQDVRGGVTFIERVPSPSATSSFSQQGRTSRDGTVVLPPMTALDDADVGEEMEEGTEDDGSGNNGNGRHHEQSADETLGLNS